MNALASGRRSRLGLPPARIAFIQVSLHKSSTLEISRASIPLEAFTVFDHCTTITLHSERSSNERSQMGSH
jgi:hypothetical protein